MKCYRQSATWLGASLGIVCALLALALQAHATDRRGTLTEEFHQTYGITAAWNSTTATARSTSPVGTGMK
jgi:hypothetical protein